MALHVCPSVGNPENLLQESMRHTPMGRTHCSLKPLPGLLGALSMSHEQSCQGYLALDLSGWQLLPTRSQGNMTLDGLHMEMPQTKSSCCRVPNVHCPSVLHYRGKCGVL